MLDVASSDMGECESNMDAMDSPCVAEKKTRDVNAKLSIYRCSPGCVGEAYS